MTSVEAPHINLTYGASDSALSPGGTTTLILDIEGIFRHARVPLDTTRPSLAAASEEAMEKQTVLLFQYGPREQFAVPLVMIRRIDVSRPPGVFMRKTTSPVSLGLAVRNSCTT